MTTCARCGRCLIRRRTFQRTIYRPGEICQFDLWEPAAEIPVGHGQTRTGWVVIGVPGLLARGRRRADLLQGDRGSVVRDPALSVVAGGAAADAGLGPPGRAARRRRPPDGGVRRVLRRAAGRLALLRRAAIRRPRASSSACRTSSSAASSRAACSRTSSTTSCSSTPGSTSGRIRGCTRRCAAGRSTGSSRSAQVMAPLPATPPDTDRRWVLRVPPDPYLRFDTCDYSLDPAAGRPARRGPHQRPRGPGGRAGHRRAGLPARALVRRASDDHRARARPHAQDPAPRAPRRPRSRSSRSARWPPMTR